MVSILSSDEITDILKASNAALRHAFEHAGRIEAGADPSRLLVEIVQRALLSIEAARSPRSSMVSVKGHASNATTRLKSVLQLLNGMPVGSADQSAVRRAAERVIALLAPLTKDEGPYELIPRKASKSRRHRSVSLESRRKRPRFELSIGALTGANFYTGMDRTIRNGGIFISTYNTYPPGTVVNIMVALTNDRFIVGSATVRWVKEYNDAAPEAIPGMGITLNNLTHTAAMEIDKYIEENEPFFYEAV